MNFYNQAWFWTGAFAVLASLGSILIKEIISSRSSLKLERIKLYESEQFKAYEQLYIFISKAYDYLWPPEDRYSMFSALMKKHYFPVFAQLLLYYKAEIREHLKILESQYTCLGDDDLIPPFDHDKFLNDEITKILSDLSNKIESHVDKII